MDPCQCSADGRSPSALIGENLRLEELVLALQDEVADMEDEMHAIKSTVRLMQRYLMQSVQLEDYHKWLHAAGARPGPAQVEG